MATIYKKELPPEFDTWTAFAEVARPYIEEGRSHFYLPRMRPINIHSRTVPLPEHDTEVWVYDLQYIQFRALGFDLSLWGHLHTNAYLNQAFKGRKNGATAEEMLNALLIAILPFTTLKE